MELDNQRESENVEDRRGIGIGVAGSLGIGGWSSSSIAAFLGYDPSRRGSTSCRTCSTSQRPADTRQAPHGTPADDMGHFVSKVLGSTEDVWSEIFQKAGHEYRTPDAGALHGRDAHRLRHGPVGHGPVLLPQRREGLHRPLVLPRPAPALPCAGRFRAGLRDRARGRPPRAEAHRAPRRRSMPRAARVSRERSQSPVGAHGAAGRLLCGRVGPPRRSEEPARPGRRGPGARRGHRHRRRPPAEAVAGLRGAGVLHPRHLGAARALVQARHGERAA